MEMLKKAKLSLAAVVITLGVLTPGTAFSLQRAPGTPNIVVLDGRTEPPISVTVVRAEVKSTQERRIVICLPLFGLRLFALPDFVNISRIWS